MYIPFCVVIPFEKCDHHGLSSQFWMPLLSSECVSRVSYHLWKSLKLQSSHLGTSDIKAYSDCSFSTQDHWRVIFQVCL